MIRLKVNGRPVEVASPPETPLLNVLREDLGLTGTKYGCGEGECGACTVLLDDKLVRSCRTPLSEAAGRDVISIEGLEADGKLHPVQEAFLKVEAFQCGYCAPGMILSAIALLRAIPSPRADEIMAWMEPNICRCGTYGRIVAAITLASTEMRKADKP